MDEKKIPELWSHLHWLTVLAQQGSYTAAAARLNVSKAAMSQRMADLERLAGVALVQRTTRSVRLTEAGQSLVDDTCAAFEQIEQSFSQVRDLAGVPRGLLRVTAPVAFARQQLVPRLADFLREYPEVRLELDLSDRLVSLATEGFDLAIRHTAAPPDTHVAWMLCPTQSVLVASRGYLRKQGTPTHPEELLRHNCLHYPRAQDTPAWTFEPRSPQPAAKRRLERPGHCAAARLQCPGQPANGQAGTGAAALDAGWRIRRTPLRHPPLFSPRAACGDGVCGVFAHGLRWGVWGGGCGGVMGMGCVLDD
ncbi:MAG: LysR family transcriptional regulator [Comamonadaceae bacterium]|nr:MAG: LysR family transcriptional regulator [Comamonadaceae bacterium]